MAFDGFVQVEDKMYPYSYKDGRITIFFGMSPVTLHNEIDILETKAIDCMTSECTIFKLTTPLCNDGMVKTGGELDAITMSNRKCDIDFKIEAYEENSVYTEMRFSFPELDYFCPSARMCNVGSGTAEFIRIPICLISDTIRYKGTDVKVELKISTSACLRVKTFAQTETNLVLTFPETNDFSYLMGLYQNVKAFFAFVCNRQNIALHQATLIGNCMKKRVRNGKEVEERKRLSSKLVPNEKYLEPDEDDMTISKTIRFELYRAHFSDLFQMFFEKEIEEYANLQSGEIHASVKYRNLIDLKQSLHITAAFEYYVRTFLPEMHSQSSIDFCRDVSDFLETYINNHTGKMKNKAKSFKNGLSPQMSLAEKMRKVIEGYDGWNAVKPILKDWFGTDYELLMRAANDWRNELAHEKRSYEPEPNTVKAVRLVEHLNYSIILRQVGYSDDEISEILVNTLAR